MIRRHYIARGQGTTAVWHMIDIKAQGVGPTNSENYKKHSNQQLRMCRSKNQVKCCGMGLDREYCAFHIGGLQCSHFKSVGMHACVKTYCYRRTCTSQPSISRKFNFYLVDKIAMSGTLIREHGLEHQGTNKTMLWHVMHCF
jgi:hypothetical protein